MTLSYNDRVVVHGLKSAAVQHLNGKTGTIVVVDTEAERYGIKIDGEEGPGVRCKMANLRVLEDPAPVPRNKRKEAAAAALRMAESFQRQMRLSTDQKQADECGCKALQLLERSRELFEEEELFGAEEGGGGGVVCGGVWWRRPACWRVEVRGLLGCVSCTAIDCVCCAVCQSPVHLSIFSSHIP